MAAAAFAVTVADVACFVDDSSEPHPITATIPAPPASVLNSATPNLRITMIPACLAYSGPTLAADTSQGRRVVCPQGDLLRVRGTARFGAMASFGVSTRFGAR